MRLSHRAVFHVHGQVGLSTNCKATRGHQLPKKPRALHLG